MEMTELGRTGIRVSRLCIGCWQAAGWETSDDERFMRTLAHALDRGLNFLDTAPAYGRGHSEELVGKVIAGRREKVVVATKLSASTTKPEKVREGLENSLRRLGTDYIDLYQQHWPQREEKMEETVALLHDQGLIENVADLYALRREHFVRVEGGRVVALPGFGGKTRKGADGEPEIVEAKRADKVLAAIEASKRRPFAAVLYALGIRHVGAVTAQALVARYPDIDALLAAGADDLAEVPGVGPVVAEAVEQYLGEEHNRETIEKLRAAGVTLEEASPGRPEGPLSGSTFVLTGKLPGLTRGQVRELIEAAGGRVVGSVSGSTDYVVVGEDPGSKLERAQALGVRVIDEGRLRELAGGG